MDTEPWETRTPDLLIKRLQDKQEVIFKCQLAGSCQIPVELNRIGIVLMGGLNPVATAEEAGIHAENHAMSTVVEYKNLIKFEDL
jgi:repressor of nif and glnA expression